MSAEVMPLHPKPFDPVRIEITSPGKQNGWPFYIVDFVEADGGRSDIYMGTDYVEAREAASWCADDGLLPVVDMIGAEPVEIYGGTIH